MGSSGIDFSWYANSGGQYKGLHRGQRSIVDVSACRL
jgi:hypothetical protein